MSSTTLNEVTLSRQAIRVLADTLEAGAEGFNRHDLHRLEDVEKKLRNALGAFGQQIADLSRDASAEAREIRAAGYQRDALDRIGWINARLGDDIQELVATLGAETTAVLLEKDELEFTKSTFNAVDKWRGNPEMRRWVFEIEEALKKENIRQVEVAPVQAAGDGATRAPDKLDQAIARNGHGKRAPARA